MDGNGKTAKKKSDKTSARGFRFVDFLIVLLCLSGAAYSINLFRLDLFQTISSRDEKPIGTITIKNNIVQRRLEDRVLWDRLFVESPVYLGDLIRVADHSAATLRIEGSNIDLDENTLIRIVRSQDGEGSFRIELDEGNLDLSTGMEEANFILDLMGRQVELGPGTILSASSGEDGMELKVSQGTASFIDEGNSRELSSGTMIALDAGGTELRNPAAIAAQPRPNARYLKNGPGLLPVYFAWTRINLDPGQALRLEIAEDRNFRNTIQLIEGLNSEAQAALDTGLWYWRLSYGEETLSNGQFTVAEAADTQLISPVTDSLYRYLYDLPELRFQWTETEGADAYLIEVSQTPEFINSRISRESSANFFVDSSLGPGTWYWRVMPVFPPVYEGRAAFSPVSFFRIEQGDSADLIIAIPEPEPLPEPEPEPLVSVNLSLMSPAPGASVPGLTALRQQTVFRWEADAEVVRSRFLLSRNSDPTQGRPQVEINNPDQTVRLDRLEEGTWYWTVEAQSRDGLVSAAAPRQLRVLSIPLLPAPLSRLPSNGRRISLEELQAENGIGFSWAAVQGANAYILSLYEEDSGGRRLIFQTQPENRTNWALSDFSLLSRGIFFWQVEAVNRGQGNRIEQRGRIEGNSFVLDVPAPGPVYLHEPGILYGN